jgi:hypothetical protein
VLYILSGDGGVLYHALADALTRPFNPFNFTFGKG